MKRSIKKKLSTSKAVINSISTRTRITTWTFEVEGSGQRKRYLRSLKDKTAA